MQSGWLQEPIAKPFHSRKVITIQPRMRWRSYLVRRVVVAPSGFASKIQCDRHSRNVRLAMRMWLCLGLGNTDFWSTCRIGFGSSWHRRWQLHVVESKISNSLHQINKTRPQAVQILCVHASLGSLTETDKSSNQSSLGFQIFGQHWLKDG